jgi:hypothetical protein
VLATLPLLCVVAIPFAFHSYDTATRPDRSAPDVAVHNFLQAFLVDRDDASAVEFTCAVPPGVDALRTYRTTIEAGEQRAGQAVSFTWIEGTVQTAGSDSASMTVHIVATVGGVSSGGSESHDWTFTAHLSGQWCVASATELK